MIGTTVSHYRIVEKLGEGGMGVVYKAHDEELDRFVALKFLPSHFVDDEAQRKRFMQEAKAISALDHPNVCTIYEINKTQQGQMFIVMAHYDGMTLKTLLQKGPLPLEKVLRYSVQIARGLSRAHEANITHRDIKPANVIITKHDDAKILDFGLAKLSHSTGLTRTGATMGTIAYMSPEQARGTKVDHRTDVWSLGVVMYEMIANERPFKGDFEQAVIYSILNEEELRLSGVAPDVPEPVARLVHRALAKDPDKRFASMRSLLSELEPLKIQVSGESPVSGTRAHPVARRSKRRWIGAVVGGVLVPAVVALFVFFPRPPGDGARDAAVAARDASHRAEQAAVTDGARERAAGEIWAADALVSRASAEFDAGRFAQAATLFETATDKFNAAREASLAAKSAGEKEEKEPAASGAEEIIGAAQKRPAQEPPKSVDQGGPSTEVAREGNAKPVTPIVTAAPDRSAEAVKERETMRQAKVELDRASGGEPAADIVDISGAAEVEKDAERLMAGGDYEEAIDRFSEATTLYREAADEARRTMEAAKREAETQRGNLQTTRSQMSRDLEFVAEYRDGLAEEQDGDLGLQEGRYVTALRNYESARASFKEAQATRGKQTSDIESVIGRYRVALEAEDLRTLASLHTDFTEQMRNDWAVFFDQVSNLRARLAIDSIEFVALGAVAHVTVQFSYSGAREEKAHQWNMVMHQRADRWLVGEVQKKL